MKALTQSIWEPFLNLLKFYRFVHFQAQIKFKAHTMACAQLFVLFSSSPPCLHEAGRVAFHPSNSMRCSIDLFYTLYDMGIFVLVLKAFCRL